MKKTTILFAIFLLMTGCGEIRQTDNENDVFITVDVRAKYPKKELMLQDFMDVEYIALETTDDFICQGVVRAIGKDIIIVKNEIDDGDIFIFDRNGKGLRKFNRKGQGGEEYISISGITLDDENDEIFVNDISTHRTRVYDLYGKFKRNLQYKEGAFLNGFINFNSENLIGYDGLNQFDERGQIKQNNRPQFTVVSKQDGSIINEIQIPFKQAKSTLMVVHAPTRGVFWASVNVVQLNSYRGNFMLVESSSDTIFNLSLDFNLTPFIVRTPSIQSMDPEIFLSPCILTDRYCFMQTSKKEYNFETGTGFPTTDLMYDRQEKNIYECAVYNGDYSTQRRVDMLKQSVNDEIAFSQKIESYQLVESYEKGELKDSQLKEIAAKLDAEDNPVIMLVKHKK